MLDRFIARLQVQRFFEAVYRHAGLIAFVVRIASIEIKIGHLVTGIDKLLVLRGGFFVLLLPVKLVRLRE